MEDNIECKFIAYSKEVASTGTPHLQGYICFENNKTKSAVIKLMPGCHIEVMGGTLTENETYCSKEAEMTKRGTPPISNKNKGRAEKHRWKETLEFAKKNQLDEIDPELRIRYYSTFKRIATDYCKAPLPLDSVCGTWIYGRTGTGKTYAVASRFPDRYLKDLNKWWDGYQGEHVVHLEEPSPEMASTLGAHLKKWADNQPFMAQIKGSYICIRPSRFIVTSNYSIDEMNFNSKDIDAIKRRFIEIEKFRDQNIIL